MLLMLAAARQAIVLDSAVRSGNFAARGRVLGVEFRGRRLLLAGYGIIGREVARRAAAFDMIVTVFDPFAVWGCDQSVVPSITERMDAMEVISRSYSSGRSVPPIYT